MAIELRAARDEALSNLPTAEGAQGREQIGVLAAAIALLALGLPLEFLTVPWAEIWGSGEDGILDSLSRRTGEVMSVLHQVDEG